MLTSVYKTAQLPSRSVHSHRDGKFFPDYGRSEAKTRKKNCVNIQRSCFYKTLKTELLFSGAFLVCGVPRDVA